MHSFFCQIKTTQFLGQKLAVFSWNQMVQKIRNLCCVFWRNFLRMTKNMKKNSKTANLLVVFVEECPSINLPEKNQFLVHFTSEKWECQTIFATMRRHIGPFLSLTISSMPWFLLKVWSVSKDFAIRSVCSMTVWKLIKRISLPARFSLKSILTNQETH